MTAERREPAAPDPVSRPTPHPALVTPLADGELEIVGRLTQASNATFLARLTGADDEVQCVYKPMQGERPLWDFPRHTLALREVAAFEVSRLAGFDLVPLTVLVDGPIGPGSLQVWVESDPALTDRLVDLVPSRKLPRKGYYAVFSGMDAGDSAVSVVHADDARLRSMAIFDALINNADRKGGHILAADDHVFGIDHGVTFHPENKLRTLLWGWAGQAILPADLERLRRVQADAADACAALLSEREIQALLDRAEDLLREGTLPLPRGGWPDIPWPIF